MHWYLPDGRQVAWNVSGHSVRNRPPLDTWKKMENRPADDSENGWSIARNPPGAKEKSIECAKNLNTKVY